MQILRWKRAKKRKAALKDNNDKYTRSRLKHYGFVRELLVIHNPWIALIVVVAGSVLLSLLFGFLKIYLGTEQEAPVGGTATTAVQASPRRAGQSATGTGGRTSSGKSEEGVIDESEMPPAAGTLRSGSLRNQNGSSQDDEPNATANGRLSGVFATPQKETDTDELAAGDSREAAYGTPEISGKSPEISWTGSAVTSFRLDASGGNGGFGDYVSKEALAFGLAFGALLLALHQWNLARQNASLTEVFERRRDTNAELVDNEGMRILVEAAMPDGAIADPPSFLKAMFVFAELDNLEFHYEKYRKGFITNEVAIRACEIFLSRCKGQMFRALAQSLVGNKYGRYREEFRRVVNKIADAAMQATAREREADVVDEE